MAADNDERIQIVIITARLVAGALLGLLFGIGGYVIGWFIVLSLPSNTVSTHYLALATGIVSGLGIFIAWMDFEGRPYHTAAAALICISGATAGSWLGLLYWQTEGSAVWNHPTAAAVIRGAVLGGNIAGLGWNIGTRLTTHRSKSSGFWQNRSTSK